MGAVTPGSRLIAEAAHTLSENELLRELKTDPNGLSEKEARQRQEEYGPNMIAIERKISPLQIFINQFKSLPVLLLILAAIVSLLLGYFNPQTGERGDSLVDALLIFSILIANGLFGFYQEYKAEKSIEALRKLAAPHARVLRNGKEIEIAIEEVVPGDILILHEGDRIPADARLLESISLYCDESMLTGESVPASKTTGALKESTLLAERRNMVFLHTVVTRGKGRAVVVATGLQTEIGKIAKEIAEAEDKVTPFQEEIEDIGKKIAYGTLGIVLIVALTELLLREGDIGEILITAISLAVAAIPEGLPAVVTIALALGTHRMLKENALMRKLATVQNLGSINVICTDKTGTLTENAMTVTDMYGNGRHIRVTGTRHRKEEEEGAFLDSEGKPQDPAPLNLLLTCAALCNDAREGTEGTQRFIGDPTETALLGPVYAAGMDMKILGQQYPRIAEIPFSSERKRMATLHRYRGKPVAFVKGAPEIVVERCTRICENGEVRAMTKTDRRRISDATGTMASRALRVLGFAFRTDMRRGMAERATRMQGNETEAEELETELIFLGLMGMMDPPREGVLQALGDCRQAGIRVVMITGDNRLTAQAVGKELGFSGRSMDGGELDQLGEEQLKKVVEEVDIYARTSPKHKAIILRMLKENRHVVAMTGDGVNDAPAIKNSDVGIAMGIRGTEVAKEASDMILLDDNFVTIRNAIAEGRGIFDNIRKFVVYLLGANLAEVLVVFLVALFGWGFALQAVHLLWINLLTDALPALALGVDPTAAGVMTRKPRHRDDRVMDPPALQMIVAMGLSATVVITFLFYANRTDMVKAQTVVFTAFVVYEMAKVYLVRARYGTPLLSNKWLHLAVASSLLLQLAVLYTPLAAYFRIVPLTGIDWVLLAGGLVAYLVLLKLLLWIEERVVPARAESVTL